MEARVSSAPRFLSIVLIFFSFKQRPVMARSVRFSNRDWAVRPTTTTDAEKRGPGPNNWDASNVWVDPVDDSLHLELTHRSGKWSCAAVSSWETLGFGRYEFQIVGRVDQFDPRVVLGLFNYAGPDGRNEIDVEIGKFVPSELDGPLRIRSTRAMQFHLDSEQRLLSSNHGHHSDDKVNRFESWLFQQPATRSSR
ncbi:hypothetical protein BV898_10163 [Hypsibius exemplaris]|uniref:GH16 domain-containing protein n=1 Tax=Hypsibius exemplaris TaxID=2072580 RepID=A0A1W0WKE6_HYPEX|nr:hypothetical protein BV898_10163 [Hypsibius exemplaris]